MKILKYGDWKQNLQVADLLERKGCDEYTLLEEAAEAGGEVFEIWWYAYGGNYHILAKQKRYPYRLYFFLTEPGDLFQVTDFQKYIETGELPRPYVSFYRDGGFDRACKS